MDFTLLKNIPRLLILIDFLKGFGNLDWNFLFCFLRAFNFGPDFIRLVETEYSKSQTFKVALQIMVLRRTFLPWNVGSGKGTHCLSVLAVEALTISVR